jgi:hypothetical protein
MGGSRSSPPELQVPALGTMLLQYHAKDGLTAPKYDTGFPFSVSSAVSIDCATQSLLQQKVSISLR